MKKNYLFFVGVSFLAVAILVIAFHPNPTTTASCRTEYQSKISGIVSDYRDNGWGAIQSGRKVSSSIFYSNSLAQCVVVIHQEAARNFPPYGEFKADWIINPQTDKPLNLTDSQSQAVFKEELAQ